MTMIPMCDLKDTAGVEKRCAEAGGLVFVTKDGQDKLVIMDIEYFKKTMSQVYEAHLVNAGLSEIEQGKMQDGDVVKKNVDGQNMDSKYSYLCFIKG